MRDNMTQKSRGFGFVTVRSETHATAAIGLSGRVEMGRMGDGRFEAVR